MNAKIWWNILKKTLTKKCQFDTSKKTIFHFKYFIGYVNHSNDNIKLLIIQFLKLKGSIKSFGNAKYVSFMLEEKNICYRKIWKRIKDVFLKRFQYWSHS